MSPGEMQNVSPEEYMLMRSWTHIVIDGINGLLGAFSKKPEQKSAAVQSLKQTAAKAGIDIPDNLVPETESTPAAPTPTDNSINLSANSAHSQKAENINAGYRYFPGINRRSRIGLCQRDDGPVVHRYR